jgi:hypothetical protein
MTSPFVVVLFENSTLVTLWPVFLRTSRVAESALMPKARYLPVRADRQSIEESSLMPKA